MTKVEAIKFGTAWLGIQEKLKGSDTYEFFKMSVKALQEEPKSEWQHDHEILKAYSDGANEVLDKIKADRDRLQEAIKTLGEDLRMCQKSIADEKALIGFNMAVAICNKHLAESEVKNESLHDESNG